MQSPNRTQVRQLKQRDKYIETNRWRLIYLTSTNGIDQDKDSNSHGFRSGATLLQPDAVTTTLLCLN